MNIIDIDALMERRYEKLLLYLHFKLLYKVFQKIEMLSKTKDPV